ncbi:MAG: TIGR02234 family membrane protein [Mycobacterium sp.]|nr:TIGR02234 family membrane protein [Mycobacterium sp.]
MIRVAQALLVLAAVCLWGASRLPWVSLQSFDDLGPPKTVVLSGAGWSTALLPLAVLLIAAALVALAVRGWLLRAVAFLVAAACLALGYLGLSLFVMPDVGPRGAAVADVPIAILVGSQRHLFGAALTLVAAVCALVAAALMMRAAASADHATTRYDSPAVRAGGQVPSDRASERVMWDALDAGDDPTDGSGPAPGSESSTEGR